MRFSLKWILAGMVYVAIAAAAFSQRTWAYGDILWAVTFLAIVYGGTLAIFARGRRQVAAGAFLIASLGFVLCVAFGGETVPTTRLLAVTGIGASIQSTPSVAYFNPYQPAYSTATLQIAPTPSTPPVIPITPGPMTGPADPADPFASDADPSAAQSDSSTPTTPINLSYNPPAVTASPVQPTATYTFTSGVDYNIYIRAANAVATLLFGLIGAMLGILAYRSVAPRPAA
jgi:hypothetical protein